MKCSYFAIERRRTFKANKKIKPKKTNTNTKNKTKKQQRSTQTKTKQNENIQRANEEYITHAKWNITRNFS